MLLKKQQIYQRNNQLQSFRTNNKSFQFLKRSNEERTDLTHVDLNPSTVRFMWRTTTPFEAASPRGNVKTTSKWQTLSSIRTLK